MFVRLGCCVVLCLVLAVAVLVPGAARAACAEEISKLMSKDTEKLTTRYNRVAKQIKQGGRSSGLIAEECRIARALQPRLEDQLAALKQSNCTRDPHMGPMIADIVRGHEDDLAMMRKTMTRSECH